MGATGVAAEQVEDMIDRFRWAAEECDNLQGIHCLFDTDSGFAGVTSKFLQELRDSDFDTTPIVAVGCDAPATPCANDFEKIRNEQRRIVNNAVSLWDVKQLASVYVPIARPHEPNHNNYLPGVSFDHTDWYQASGVLGCALHTASLPYRLTEDHVPMYSYCQAIAGVRKAVNIPSWRVALPLSADEPVIQDDHSQEWQQMASLGRAGGAGYGADYSMRNVCRSENDNRLKKESEKAIHLRSDLSLLTSIDDNRDKNQAREQMALLSEMAILEGAVNTDLLPADRPNRIRQNFTNAIAKGIMTQQRASFVTDRPLPLPITAPMSFSSLKDRSKMSSLSYMYVNDSMYKGVLQMTREFHETISHNSSTHQFAKHGLIGDDWKEITEGLLSLSQDYKFQ